MKEVVFLAQFTVQVKPKQFNSTDYELWKLVNPGHRRAAYIFIGGNEKEIAGARILFAMNLTPIPYYYRVTCEEDLSRLPEDDLQRYNAHYISLVNGTGADHRLRHQAVEKLRALGDGFIAVVWVDNPYAKAERYSPKEWATINALRQNPPNVDGIDCLLTMEP